VNLCAVCRSGHIIKKQEIGKGATDVYAQSICHFLNLWSEIKSPNYSGLGKTAGPAYHRRKLPADNIIHPVARIHERSQIDPRFYAAAIQHVDEILGRDISRGSRRERAAAQAADAGINGVAAYAFAIPVFLVL
jgi:hypothetical protein